MSNTRFDLVWRRIPQSSISREFERAFGDRNIRLDRMNNWGVLSWIHPHAEASKRSHHYGVERNVGQFFSSGDVVRRRKHEASLRSAGHALHWGHLPLGFAGEDALLQLVRLEPRAKQLVDEVVQTVIDAAELSCDQDGHDCVWQVSNDGNFFTLYRWLSAWLVLEEWTKVWEAIGRTPVATPTLDEAETKAQILKSLVCTEDRGYKVLSMCNKADFVPRDLLQSGTAWLTLDIEALWETNPLGSDAAREWALIDAAANYLGDRFYSASDSLLVHSLASKAIAGAMRSRGIGKAQLRSWLQAGDDFFESTHVPEYHRARLRRIREACAGERLLENWLHMGPFTNVGMSSNTRFQLEDELSGKTGFARATYPFTQRFNIHVEVDHRDRSRQMYWRDVAKVHVHQDVEDGATSPETAAVLAVAGKIRERMSPRGLFGDEIMGWLTGETYDSTIGNVAAVASTFCEDPDFIDGLKNLSRRELVRGALAETDVEYWCRLVASGEEFGRQDAWRVLNLPWRAAKLAGARRSLAAARKLSLTLAESNDPNRGYAFEAAVAADQWTSGNDPIERFVFLNSQALTEERMRGRELDIVRVDVAAESTVRISAIECSLDNSQSKRTREARSLNAFAECVRQRFGCAIHVATQHARLVDGQIQYQPAA